MAIRDQINNFFDDWGTLDKKSYVDGGDSCHRVGMYFTLLGLMDQTFRRYYPKRSAEKFNEIFNKHHVAPGVFVRHPNPDWDASDWDRMSRDQFQPMIMAAGLWDRKQLRDVTLGHLKRGFLFTNNTRRNGSNKKNHGLWVAGESRNYNWKFPDVTGPEIWAVFIRAWGAWWLWPLLLLLDVETLLGALKWRLWPSHNIAMNHGLVLLYSKHRLPTPITWLAEKLFTIEECISLIGEHFRDFPADMVFFEEMFKDAAKTQGLISWKE